MKGSIKLANVSIKYKEKNYKVNHAGRKVEFLTTVVTKKVEILIVIDEEKRVLKFKNRAIKKVCSALGLHFEKIVDPNINSIEIIKDLGKTSYEID